MYLKQTVTSRRIPFTFEGIEKLKALREHYNNIGLGWYPLPTIIDHLVQQKYSDLEALDTDSLPQIPEYIPSTNDLLNDPLNEE